MIRSITAARRSEQRAASAIQPDEKATYLRSAHLSYLSLVDETGDVHDLYSARKGLITRVTSSFADEGWSYEYDELDRLIAATNSSSSEYDQTLEYDAIGNITYKGLPANLWAA